MLTVYGLAADRSLKGRVVHEAADLDAAVLWVDLQNPSDQERRWVAEIYAQDLPTPESIVEIEASSRFFEAGGCLHLRSYFLQEEPDNPRNLTVAFILDGERLITIRDQNMITFDTFQERAARSPNLVTDPTAIFLRLFETKVDRLADLLEALHAELESLGDQILRTDKRDLEDIMARLARAQNINDKTRLTLRDKQRSLSFLQRAKQCPVEATSLVHEILDDIESLNAHSTFLFEKMEFLMDATLGLINIEQNKIIKIFSIAAVVFLPPTLVASIYGMNFQRMPELSWVYGYPLSLLSMVFAGAGVYWYFKRKGWL
jgi:magnesium transporter